jgi:hypothetical protein
MYSTSRIVGSIPNSSHFKTGTGFFFIFPAEGGEYVPALITNKHVIEGTASLQFLVHTSSTKDAKLPDANAGIQSAFADWTYHPKPKVDLCALLLGPVMNSMAPIYPFFRGLDSSLIKSDAELKDLNAVGLGGALGMGHGLTLQTWPGRSPSIL